jgi:hypothetical protein
MPVGIVTAIGVVLVSHPGLFSPLMVSSVQVSLVARRQTQMVPATAVTSFANSRNVAFSTEELGIFEGNSVRLKRM